MVLFDGRGTAIAAERAPEFLEPWDLAQDAGKIFSDPALRLLVISSPLSRGLIARFAGERLYL